MTRTIEVTIADDRDDERRFDGTPEPEGDDYPDRYEVILTSNGDRATAATGPDALRAARALVDDIAARGASTRLHRQTLVVAYRGRYNGPLTAAARAGRDRL